MFSTRTEDVNCQSTSTNKVNSLAVSLLDEWVKWLSKGIHNEPNLPKLLMVQQVAAIKDESRLHHCLIYSLKVIGLELIPLSEHCQSMRIIACLIWVCCHRDSICFLVLLAAGVIPLKLGCGQICEDLLPCDLHINMTVKQAAVSLTMSHTDMITTYRSCISKYKAAAACNLSTAQLRRLQQWISNIALQRIRQSAIVMQVRHRHGH